MKWRACPIKLVAILALGMFCGPASADLVITEVMSSSQHPGGDANGDWWELTNTDSTSISLLDYSWDDSDRTPGVTTFPDITLEGFSSVLIVDEPIANLPGFQQAWDLDLSEVQLVSREDFGGPPFFPGLSSGGDEVNLFDASNMFVTRAVFGSAFGGGRSFAWDIDGAPMGLSTAGSYGAYLAEEDGSGGEGRDVASPGWYTPQWSPTGPLVTTEVMSNSRHPIGGDANGDWWELTNTGTESISLLNYSWDDFEGYPGNSVFPEVTIGPGESVLIVDEGDVAGFAAAWGLNPSVQVLSQNEFTGGAVNFSGLDANGDEVNLYNSNHELIGRVTFGDSGAGGFTFEWARDGTFLDFSVAGENGAYVAPGNGDGGLGTDVGSPAITVSGTGVLLGDVNLDEAVNGLDVTPFVDRVLAGTYQIEADTNEDGSVNGLDVTSFVDAVLAGGGAAAVPEPSTTVLLLAGLATLWVRRRND